MNNFAVCILSYNREIDLKKTLHSFDKIGFPSKNIFIFDDNSIFNDKNSLEFFKRYNFIVNKKNIGLSKNISNINKLNNFNYILLFEDHDLIHPEFFNETSKVFKKNKDLAFIVTERVYIDKNDNIIKKSKPVYKQGVFDGNNYIVSELSKFNFSHPLCVAINQKKLNKINFLNLKKFWFYGDIYLWLSLARNNKIFFINKPLYFSRLRENDHVLGSLEKLIKTIHEVNSIHSFFINENNQYNRLDIKIKFLIRKYIKLVYILSSFKIRTKKNIEKKYNLKINILISLINLIPYNILRIIKNLKDK
jgi:hypothetical protein